MIDLLDVPRWKCIGLIETYWWTIWFCYHGKIFVDCTRCWAIVHNWSKIIWCSVIVKSVRYISKINSETVIAPGTSLSPYFDMIMRISTEKIIFKNNQSYKTDYIPLLLMPPSKTMHDFMKWDIWPFTSTTKPKWLFSSCLTNIWPASSIKLWQLK